MRLWTAAGAWAGLLAVSLALVSTGLALNANRAGSGDTLTKVAIGFGALASVIFAGDLSVLGRREWRRWRAQRTAPPKFGALDFGPEFVKAAQEYAAAQSAIDTANAAASRTVLANAPLADQSGANAVAKAVGDLSLVLSASVPAMRDTVIAMRACLLVERLNNG